MKKIITTIYILISISIFSIGQDASFSQFFHIPQLINPALVGTQRCNTYAVFQYRNQEQAVTSHAYNTFAASAEHRFEAENNDNMLGIGLVLSNDVAGKSNYQVSQALISAAGHLRVGDQQFLSGGLQGGIIQRQLDFGQMIFDEQFNGTFYDLSMASGENFSREQMLHLDVSGGLAFSSMGNYPFNIGFAVFHVNSPNISFTEDSPVYLPWKYTGYLSGAVPMGSSQKDFLVYHTMMLFQSPFNEINVGAGYRKNLGETSLYLGGIIKLNDFRSGTVRDAVVAIANIEKAGWNFGVSFDFSTNQLARANYSFSTVELVFAKAFGDCKEFLICPRF